jgi:hypothetical protein
MLVTAAGLGVVSILRARESEAIGRRGAREDALFVSSVGGLFERRVVVRYDVPDGRILQVAIPVDAELRRIPGDRVAVQFDRRRPSRARVAGRSDPGPWMLGVAATALAGSAAMLVGAHSPRASGRARIGLATAGVLAAAVSTVALLLDAAVPVLAAHASARDAVPVCARVDGLTRGSASLVDRDAPSSVDQTSVLRLPSRMPSKSPLHGLDDEGGKFLSLDQAAAARRDPAEGARVLKRYGYVGGYVRRWSGATTDVTVMAFVFSSERNARAFDTYATRYVCPYDRDAFADALGIGSVIEAPGHVAAQITFVRGPVRFLAGVSGFAGSTPSRADVEAVAGALAAAAG